MTFRHQFWFHAPSLYFALLFQKYYFYCNLQTIRIERGLIKHTFLQHFLHYVNMICINITKRDPNNLSIFFFSLGMCFSDHLFFFFLKMPYDCPTVIRHFLCRLSWYWVFPWVKSQDSHSSQVFISDFIPLLDDFQKSPRSTTVLEGKMFAICGVYTPWIS